MTKFNVDYYGEDRLPNIYFECDAADAAAAADAVKALYARLTSTAAPTVQHVGQTAPATPTEAPKNKGGRPRKNPPAVVTTDAGDITDLGGTPATPATEPRQISTGENRTSPEDDAADLWGTSPAAAAIVISDRDITDACTRKVAADKSLTPKVKALIAATGAMTASALPQDKRQKFLHDLEALK